MIKSQPTKTNSQCLNFKSVVIFAHTLTADLNLNRVQARATGGHHTRQPAPELYLLWSDDRYKTILIYSDQSPSRARDYRVAEKLRRSRLSHVETNAPLGRFAFGKTPRGPRCARQARQRLARSRAARAACVSTWLGEILMVTAQLGPGHLKFAG